MQQKNVIGVLVALALVLSACSADTTSPTATTPEPETTTTVAGTTTTIDGSFVAAGFEVIGEGQDGMGIPFYVISDGTEIIGVRSPDATEGISIATIESGTLDAIIIKECNWDGDDVILVVTGEGWLSNFISFGPGTTMLFLNNAAFLPDAQIGATWISLETVQEGTTPDTDTFCASMVVDY